MTRQNVEIDIVPTRQFECHGEEIVFRYRKFVGVIFTVVIGLEMFQACVMMVDSDHCPTDDWGLHVRQSNKIPG